jgi:WD40 repeat protein
MENDAIAVITQFLSETPIEDKESPLAQGTRRFLGEGTAKDFSLAFDHWRRAYHLDARCCYLFAVMLDFGLGCARDAAGAWGAYRSSAEAGCPAAMLAMGRYYLTGYYGAGFADVTPNPGKAAHWIRKAAEAGLAQAMYELGLAYAADSGERAAQQANQWVSKAAKKGHLQSIEWIAANKARKNVPTPAAIVQAHEDSHQREREKTAVQPSIQLCYPILSTRGQRVLFSRQGRHLLTEGPKDARVWHAETGEPAAPPFAGSGASLSSDGKLIAFGNEVWTVEPSPRIVMKTDVVGNMEFGPGDAVVLVVGSQAATIWDVSRQRRLFSPVKLEPSRWPIALLSPDGAVFATNGANEQRVQLWHSADGTPVGPPLAHRDRIQCAQFSDDSAHIYTGGADDAVRIWDAHTGKPVSELLKCRATVDKLFVANDARRLVTIPQDGDSGGLLWNYSSRGFQPTSLRCRDGYRIYDQFYTAAFSPDGRRLGVAGKWKGYSLGEWWLVDLDTLDAVAPVTVTTCPVKSLAFSPDGSRLAVGWDYRPPVYDEGTPGVGVYSV